jgi:hypothetical protein
MPTEQFNQFEKLDKPIMQRGGEAGGYSRWHETRRGVEPLPGRRGRRAGRGALEALGLAAETAFFPISHVGRPGYGTRSYGSEAAKPDAVTVCQQFVPNVSVPRVSKVTFTTALAFNSKARSWSCCIASP